MNHTPTEVHELEEAEREFDQTTEAGTLTTSDSEKLSTKVSTKADTPTRAPVREVVKSSAELGRESMQKVNEELKEQYPGREVVCGECRRPYLKLRRPSDGQEVPELCPHCFPDQGRGRRAARPDAEQLGAVVPEPFEGDMLEVLHDAGVNVNKYQDAYLGAKHLDWSDDPHVIPKVNRYLQMWADTRGRRYPRREWMYLYGAGSTRTTLGKLGNGKTVIAIAIARELIKAGLLVPAKFAFRTAETLLLQCEATFKSNATDSEMELLRQYSWFDLLIIDDVGVREDPRPHAARVFDELTKRREAKATIWTSNISIPVLEAQGNAWRRVASRIAGECGEGSDFVIDFRGRDRRAERSRR